MTALPDWRRMDPAERDLLLIQLCNDGLSAGKIAAKFSDCTRSSVIGRVHRLQKGGRQIELRGNYPRFAPTTWERMSPAEKNQAVKERMQQGRTYREIGAELGVSNHLSVGAVVARLREAGELPERDQRESGALGGAIARIKADRQKANLTALNIAVANEGRAEAPGISISRAAAFDPIRGVEPITLDQFTASTCKWAVDGLNGPSRLFCGAPKEPEQSFCLAHRRLAYIAPTSRAGRPAERITA